MRSVRVSDSITYNPDTGSYAVYVKGRYVGSTTQRSLAVRWSVTPEIAGSVGQSS